MRRYSPARPNQSGGQNCRSSGGMTATRAAAARKASRVEPLGDHCASSLSCRVCSVGMSGAGTPLGRSRRSCAALVNGDSADSFQGSPGRPVMVAAKQEINLMRTYGGRRNKHHHDGRGWATAAPVSKTRRPRPVIPAVCGPGGRLGPAVRKPHRLSGVVTRPYHRSHLAWPEDASSRLG
jgi:hypothetical protein